MKTPDPHPLQDHMERVRFRRVDRSLNALLFFPLYLIFCYLLCVNWVNNVAFHDLGIKYGQRTKIVQKRH